MKQPKIERIVRYKATAAGGFPYVYAATKQEALKLLQKVMVRNPHLEPRF